MRASALISIRPVLEQAIAAINDSFEREQQSQKNAADFEQEYKRLLALSEGIAPTTKLEQSSTKQQPRVRLSRPSIEGLYPWRHRVVLAANALAECGWTIEAGAIHDELNNLPKQQVDWAQPGVRDEMKADIQKVGTRIRDVLACCITEILANKSDASSILQSSKPENATRTVDNFDVARAREQLRPYVEKSAFREYLKERILEWEAWHRLQVDQIRMHEIDRDHAKEQLDRAISQGTFDPEDEEKDLANVLSYEWHEDEVTSIPRNFEFKLVAEGEPFLFHAASVAAMVALFWCDINHSNKLVPDYPTLPDFDPLDPYGPFNKYLFEQWNSPVPGRYEHIDWFVDAAINAYESKIEGGSVLPPTKQESQDEIDDNRPKGDELAPPEYDPNSADWILSETLCNVIGIKASTIADYRKPRKCGEDTIDEFGSWSVDCVGKFRRQVNRKGSVAYYRPAMSSAYTAKLEYAESQKRQKP